MATTENTGPTLSIDVSLGEVIDAVNELAAESAGRRGRVSPSEPLDGAHPSASLVVPDDAYDALLDRLEAPANPNQRLRKTMAAYFELVESDE